MTRTALPSLLLGVLLATGCGKSNLATPAKTERTSPSPTKSAIATKPQPTPGKPVEEPKKDKPAPVSEPPKPVETDPAVLALEGVGGKVVRDTSKPERPVVRVDLSNSAAGDATLERLRAWPDLRELDLRGTRIGNTGLVHL